MACAALIKPRSRLHPGSARYPALPRKRNSPAGSGGSRGARRRDGAPRSWLERRGCERPLSAGRSQSTREAGAPRAQSPRSSDWPLGEDDRENASWPKTRETPLCGEPTPCLFSVRKTPVVFTVQILLPMQRVTCSLGKWVTFLSLTHLLGKTMLITWHVIFFFLNHK